MGSSEATRKTTQAPFDEDDSNEGEKTCEEGKQKGHRVAKHVLFFVQLNDEKVKREIKSE